MFLISFNRIHIVVVVVVVMFAVTG